MKARVEAYFPQVRDAFALPIREFNRRVRAIAALERWRRGEDDTVEGRLGADLQRFMERAASGRE